MVDFRGYNSDVLDFDIFSLKKAYSFLQFGSIGKSVLGKNINYIRFGNGKKEVFYSAGIHANEWITSLLLIKFIQELCFSYTNNLTIFGYNVRELFENTSLFVVPMCNPDGVDLVNDKFRLNSSTYLKAKKISQNYPNIPFPSGWKANICGVDLNLQFPAGWQKAKRIKFQKGFVSPAPRDFVGFKPLSEPESLALYNFTLLHNFNLILAYHTQGKEIYWNFQNYAPKKAKIIGNIFSNLSLYKLANVPYQSSFAGYKDWFLQTYKKPAYTIEAGFGNNPLPISQFNQIYQENLGILVLGLVLA